MNAQSEAFARTADLSNFESAIPRGEQSVFLQIRNYVDLMRSQKREIKTIPVFGHSFNAFMKAVNNGRQDDSRFSALTFKGIPVEATR